MHINEPPIIFFAFANDNSRFLSYLKAESAAIYKALLPIDSKGSVKVIREESTNIDDLFNIFQAYRNRIAIFHYGGHADGEKLILEDQNSNISPLAQLIAEQKNTIKLVFLNGCGTIDQVQYLHKLGIPIVIATSSSVSDPKAQMFASRFYSALANHYSLEEAFLHAKSFVELKFNQVANIRRDVLLSMDDQDEEFEWGLYVSEEAPPNILEWKLPQYFICPPPASMQVSYAVNKNMLRLFKALIEKSPQLANRPYPTEEAMIITSFPWVISVHLFRLFADAESMSVAGLPRLRELIQAYVSTTRFLSYIGLAQLWNELKSGTLNMDDDFREFHYLNQNQNNSFDYLQLLQRICEILKEGTIDWFLPELKSIAAKWQVGSADFDQYRFVESIRWRLRSNNISAEEIEESCYICESVLTELLREAANLANYKLLAVRDIRIINPGHISVSTPFEHMIGDLHVPFQTYLKHRPQSLEDYINSHCVVLTQSSSANNISRYLNLSPFYLDKTAFGNIKGKNTPSVYTLDYWDNKSFVFQNVNFNVNNHEQIGTQNSIDFLHIHNGMEEYQIVIDQMNAFIKDISLMTDG